MRILLAEDETEIAKGLKYLLEKNRFAVDIAQDGVEALDYFEEISYDVVILDIMMPRMDGLEVLRTIRAKGSSVPVLMLTAKAEIEDRVTGSEAAHTTRFFAVHCKDNGEMMILSKDFISTVDDQTAREYAQEILQKGKQRGYYQDFRYLVSKGEGEDVILFLNVLHPLQSMRLLLAVSSVIGVVSFLVVLALVILFSKRAIRPYAQNIARQKQFITNASHELKTPITSIATSVDILVMEYEENEWIVSIQKQIQKMTRLVGDLVALSRLDEDMPFPEREQFSLSEATWEIAEPFAALAEAKKKEYSPENGKISLRVFKKKNKAAIEVFNTCHLENTGELNRIFERFYRLEESHSAATGGTGIGLSMAQAIVEAHGGKIEAVSTDGESLKIVVVL